VSFFSSHGFKIRAGAIGGIAKATMSARRAGTKVADLFVRGLAEMMPGRARVRRTIVTQRERDARRTSAARDADRDTDQQSPEIETPSSNQVPVIADETDLTTTAHSLGDIGFNDASDADLLSADVEPSMIDQELLTDPTAAAGPSDSWEDPVEDGEEVYVPPTDPVITTGVHGDTEVLGGFSTDSMETRGPLHSSDGEIGDEAIADAVRAALRQDAATTDLQVDVIVEDGIARLYGAVPGLEDVDNAEAVAGRVEGVVEVMEELQVAGV
jgi:hypothetical protein